RGKVRVTLANLQSTERFLAKVANTYQLTCEQPRTNDPLVYLKGVRIDVPQTQLAIVPRERHPDYLQTQRSQRSLDQLRLPGPPILT
ncbi:hypothetical protein BLA29_013269, partial [Euroglyphus maynei]